jgi:glutathione synthase/RimK-type ligase-like ATP-grasp enzyme
VEKAHPLRMSDLAPQEKAQVGMAAMECLRGHRASQPEPAAQRPKLAILYNEDGADKPSNSQAMRRFMEAAEESGMRAEVIDRNDIGRLAEFDALFIRDTTFVNHYTYQFARSAAIAGLVTVDDPDSILKCSNKVYLTEILARHDIPTPRTLTVHRENVKDIVPQLGLPCILKQPDGAFSSGVVKARTEEEVMMHAMDFLEKSDLILAQEYLPTEFDWRIGVFDRKPLFACRYYMVPGHWQIVSHEGQEEGSGYVEGRTEAVPIEDAPREVIETALAAANLIGDGFYGVDLKQRGQHCYIIEVNDNPNVDAGNEDALLGNSLYLRIMDVFRSRVARRKESVRA